MFSFDATPIVESQASCDKHSQLSTHGYLALNKNQECPRRLAFSFLSSFLPSVFLTALESGSI